MTVSVTRVLRKEGRGGATNKTMQVAAVMSSSVAAASSSGTSTGVKLLHSSTVLVLPGRRRRRRRRSCCCRGRGASCNNNITIVAATAIQSPAAPLMQSSSSWRSIGGGLGKSVGVFFLSDSQQQARPSLLFYCLVRAQAAAASLGLPTPLSGRCSTQNTLPKTLVLQQTLVLQDTHSNWMDAIPLLIGTLLSANAAGFQAMVIVWIWVGFSIGVSSGVVPLYISQVKLWHSSSIINDGQTGTQETLDGPVPGLLLPENFASRICATAVVLSLGVHWIRETDASRVNLQPRLPVLPTRLELDLLMDS